MPTDRAPDPAGTPVLSLRGIGKRYGDTVALHDVSLDIAEGEIVGLLGHNGAGKSTLMSLTAGLLRPDTGQVQVCGEPVARARHRLGLAPQDLGVYPPLTVRQNLCFFAELAGLRGRDVHRRTDDVAEPLGLTALLDRRVARLSGGEQRRVHTAVALLHRPRLLLLDEPTAGVDVETRTRLIDFVRDLAATGTAVCYSTHYLAEVEALDADVAVLDHGRLIAKGSLQELVRSHGGGWVELTFTGAPPEARLPWPVTDDGDTLRVRADQPHLALPEILAALGDGTSRLTNLNVVRPSLESVFLHLTGRRYTAQDDSPAGPSSTGPRDTPDGPSADGPRTTETVPHA
ncbi:ABC transporter ATP-binding protein [Streptomyces ossamyceticus]|uniref:ABC transporter ATP-binding protein n=1 Tax=Streptomyces ossamyceticus TaxID=249581 RepID=A0ABV2V527_9ACTN